MEVIKEASIRLMGSCMLFSSSSEKLLEAVSVPTCYTVEDFWCYLCLPVLPYILVSQYNQLGSRQHAQPH